MKRFLARASVAGLSAALVAGAALVAAPAASAAPATPGNPGLLGFSSGINDGIWNSQNDTFTVTTQDACPAGGTYFQIAVAGPSVPAPPNDLIQGNTAGSTVGGTLAGSFSAPVALSLSGFAQAKAIGQYLPAGTYTMTLTCRAQFVSASLGDYIGQFSITGSGASSVVSAIKPDLSTTIAIDSASPASGGTAPVSASFTASVSPTNAVGSVQFKVNGVNFGAPVAKTAASATVTVPATPAPLGNSSVTAEFTGGSNLFNDFLNSVSSAFPYEVVAQQEATTTLLALDSTSVTNGTPVTATATVTYGAATAVPGGSVRFFLNGAQFGADVPVNASGVATKVIATGVSNDNAVTVQYLGFSQDPVQYLTSNGGPIEFDVAPNATPLSTDEQGVIVTVPEGAITITTPYFCVTVDCSDVYDATTNPTGVDRPLNLGSMALVNDVEGYRATGRFESISVLDTRAGDQPWTAQAQSSNFTRIGGTEVISAYNVGLEDIRFTGANPFGGTYGTNIPLAAFTLDQPAGGANAAGFRAITAFDNPAAQFLAPGTIPVAPAAVGLGGSPKKIIHANNGLGTTTGYGTLEITAPTSTVAGTYSGTVTFTVIGF